MEAAGYATLTRQTGLMREMQMIANNIANAATTGYRAEGMIFSEFVARADGAPSLSMARGNTPVTSQLQGALEATGGAFDFAIEGEGFFLIDTPEGDADGGIWSAGMVQGLIDDIPTVKELIDTIIADANAIINGRLAAMTK